MHIAVDCVGAQILCTISVPATYRHEMWDPFDLEVNFKEECVYCKYSRDFAFVPS